MKDIIKKIEKATNTKAVILHEKDLGTGERYEIALVDDEIGADMFVSIVHAHDDKNDFWYIKDVCSLSKASYCVIEYTIKKIEEELKQCGQSK